MQVVRAIAIQETASQQMQRIIDLERKLFSPKDAARAAVQLEAIGRPGVDTLMKGMQSSDREVQFYSAEALAYLGRREAAEPLGRAARDEPAFRVSALTALAVLDDPAAAEQLHNLLAAPSAETRYGAFRALWIANPNDPVIKGEQLGGQFSYHVLDTAGSADDPRHAEPSRRGRALRPPADVLHSLVDQRRQPDHDHQLQRPAKSPSASSARTTPTRSESFPTGWTTSIRAIVELGGTYPDVVQAIQEAKAAGALPSRFEVETMPEGGRKYERHTAGERDAPCRKRRGIAAAEGLAGDKMAAK